MEPMSKFCDPTSQCYLYKIPWNLLGGVTGPSQLEGEMK